MNKMKAVPPTKDSIKVFTGSDNPQMEISAANELMKKGKREFGIYIS